MARQILCGLNHLHNHSVLHRDIKSMNILVTEHYNCKITDFGMSKLITDDLCVFNTANAGTPLWMAPEVKAGVYGFPADVYSTGLVLYEILEEKLPQFDKSLDRIILPESYYFKKVVYPLICPIPTERKTATDAIEVFDAKLVNGIVERIVTDMNELKSIKNVLDDAYLQKLYEAIAQKNPDYLKSILNLINL